jgi:hypothetical protein
LIFIFIFLQALDSHIIADDEIIEKTRFREPYSAYSNPFKLNLYIPTGKVRRSINNI